MSDLIQDRSETINTLAALMRDINDMTGDIKDQTTLQGNNLIKVEEELGDAAENVEQANEQLEQKMTRERTGNKCLIWCVIIAIIVVIILIYMSFIRNGDDDVVIKYEYPEQQQPVDPSQPTPYDQY